MKYRKKPVVIEAIQFTGENWKEINDFTKRGISEVGDGADEQGNIIPRPHYALIYTLEGVMRADINDWVIKGVKGEFYPCKPDIFEATYEKVIEGIEAFATPLEPIDEKELDKCIKTELDKQGLCIVTINGGEEITNDFLSKAIATKFGVDKKLEMLDRDKVEKLLLSQTCNAELLCGKLAQLICAKFGSPVLDEKRVK